MTNSIYENSIRWYEPTKSGYIPKIYNTPVRTKEQHQFLEEIMKRAEEKRNESSHD